MKLFQKKFVFAVDFLLVNGDISIIGNVEENL